MEPLSFKYLLLFCPPKSDTCEEWQKVTNMMYKIAKPDLSHGYRSSKEEQWEVGDHGTVIQVHLQNNIELRDVIFSNKMLSLLLPLHPYYYHHHCKCYYLLLLVLPPL